MRRITFLFALLSLTASAQPVKFKYTYGGTSPDYGHSAKQTFDHGYIAAGSASSFGAGTMDMMLVRTDSMGAQQWVKTYGGTNVDWGFSVQQTTDTGFVIAGYTNSFGAGGYDFYLVKTDSMGNVKWWKTYGGADWDFGWSVQQTSDGGYILTGGTYSTPNGDEDVYLVKTNSQGDTLWTKRYGGPMQDEGHAVKQTSDGGYIITGFSKTATDTLGNVYVIKTNSAGDTTWTRKYGGSKMDFGNDVIENTFMNVYMVGGGTSSFGAIDLDFYLLQLKPDGDTAWTSRIKPSSGNGDDAIGGLSNARGNKFAFIGYNYAASAGFNDIFFFLCDSDGYYIDATTYGTYQHEDAFSIENTSDNGFIICGYTDSTQAGFGPPNLFLIKTDSLGNTTKKILLGSEPVLAKAEVALDIHPNPSTGRVRLRLSSAEGERKLCKENIRASLFDARGADVSNGLEVRDLIISPGSLQIDIVVTDLPPGIYFVCIAAENRILGNGKLLISND